MAPEVARYRTFRGDQKRLDATSPDAAAVALAGLSKVDLHKVADRAQLSETDRFDLLEALYPTEDIHMTTRADVTRIDVTDEPNDTNTGPQAKRDAIYANAWRTTDAERLDAAKAKAKTPGRNRDRNTTLARAWSGTLGVLVKRGDIKRVIKARGGDADLSRVDADAMRRMIRAGRDAKAAAKAAKASTATSTNTDANELPDVEAVKARRDAALAGAWKAGAT